MKGFIITSILTIILIICIFINWSYVNSVCNKMLEFSRAISNTPSAENTEAIQRLDEYWKSQLIKMKISVNSRDIDDISNLIDTIKAANECKDSHRIAINIELLINAIEKIIQLEKISTNNILKNDSPERVILVFLRRTLKK